MKYLLILALLFFTGHASVSATLAAPADPDRLPQNRPLLPMDAHSGPNYKGNINSTLESGPFQPVEQNQEPQEVQKPTSTDVQQQDEGFSFWLALIAALAVLLIIYVLKRSGFFKT